jgi:hypothetical protein
MKKKLNIFEILKSVNMMVSQFTHLFIRGFIIICQKALENLVFPAWIYSFHIKVNVQVLHLYVQRKTVILTEHFLTCPGNG